MEQVLGNHMFGNGLDGGLILRGTVTSRTYTMLERRDNVLLLSVSQYEACLTKVRTLPTVVLGIFFPLFYCACAT